MPAFTTRLGLYKPGGGSSGLITPDEVVDIDKLNDNFDKIDANIGIAVVTSTTRPSTPFVDQIIDERDTGRMLRWDGTDWVDATLDPLAVSLANSNTVNPPAVPNNSVNTPVASVTYNSPTARRVLCSVNYRWSAGANAAGNDELRIGTAATLVATAAFTPSVRAVNNAQTFPFFMSITGTVPLVKGVNVISLFGNAEAGGVARTFNDVRISVYPL